MLTLLFRPHQPLLPKNETKWIISTVTLPSRSVTSRFQLTEVQPEGEAGFCVDLQQNSSIWLLTGLNTSVFVNISLICPNKRWREADLDLQVCYITVRQQRLHGYTYCSLLLYVQGIQIYIHIYVVGLLSHAGLCCLFSHPAIASLVAPVWTLFEVEVKCFCYVERVKLIVDPLDL